MLFRVFWDTIRANRRNFELLLCILMSILHNNNFFCIDVFKVSSAIYHKSCKIQQLYMRFLHKIACFRNRRNLHLRTFLQPCGTSVFCSFKREICVSQARSRCKSSFPRLFSQSVFDSSIMRAHACAAYRVSRIILFIIILFNIFN